MSNWSTAAAGRWQARRAPAALLRAFVLLAPLVCSLLLVHVFSLLLPVPTDSFVLYLIWWIGISGAATLGLVVVDRLARRLLPLAALLKLSLVFPDEAPSRLRTALSAGGVESLEERLREARSNDLVETSAEAAQRLLALVAALDAHDRLTRGHAERVRGYSRLIAKELGLSNRELDLLNWSALLHDIGKLEVPSEILTKPGKPTEAEWRVLQNHPERGETLVAPLREWLGEWAKAVGEHHERWDGRGYPRGREGAEISLAARIVAVADVFDVITSARSYKGASSTIDARQELARSAGSQLDPRVVRAFLSVSLGRLRLIMGPLSWLAHAPILGRIPLSPAVSSLAATVAVVATAVTTGSVHVPDPPSVPSADVAQAAPLVFLSDVERAMEEDSVAVIHLPGVTGSDELRILRIVERPYRGVVAVVGGKIRFAPPADFHGSATIQYEACWTHVCRVGVLHVEVRPVNDKPLAVDDRASTRTNQPVIVSVLGNDSDADGDALSLLATRSRTGGLAVVLGDNVRWEPPVSFRGTGRVTYLVSDGNGGRASATVEIAVRGIGSPQAPGKAPSGPETGPPTPPSTGAPEASPPASQPSAPKPPPPPPLNRPPHAADDLASVLEHAVVDIDVLANDSDPDGDALTLESVSAPQLGTAELSGNVVRYTAPATGGTTSVEYVVRDSHGATARASVAVTVRGVNDPPSFDAGPDQTVLEGSGATEVAEWARNISPGPPDESGQRVSFRVEADRPGLFAQVPRVDSSGTLRFATADSASGSTGVTIRAVDDGGTANGGVDTSALQRFTITIVSVNSPPSFTAGLDQVVAEDAGPQTVAGWAHNIRSGPENESSQSVSFTVSTNKPALFSAGPVVSPNGTLTFTPASNATGTATVTVRAVDDGGTANGGENTSAPVTFTITVTPVNDPPVAVDDAVSTDENAPVTFDVLQNDTDVDAGDTLSIVSFDASSLVDGMVTSNGGGSLVYTPDPAFNGIETFTYVVGDAAGATDVGTVTITINGVSTPPTAATDAYATSAGTQLTISAPGLLANDADEDGDTLSVQTSPVSGPSHGTLNLNDDGSFTYDPNISFVGTDTFTYRVDDGTGLTADADVTITVSLVSSSDTLYFQAGGPSSEVWDMSLSAPPAALPVPDFDGDGDPGLTIEKSGGGEGENDPRKRHEWIYQPVVPLQLNGPVTLDLWSTVEDFKSDKDAHPHVYLYDCLAGGAGCAKLAETEVHVRKWNRDVADWVLNSITVGSVTHAVQPGRELRVRLLVQHEDIWVAMTAAHPTALAVTLG